MIRLCFICILLVSSCGKNIEEPCSNNIFGFDHGCGDNSPNLNQNLTLYESDDISIKLIDIEDERCPCDALCYIAGQADVSLQISNMDTFVEVITFIVPDINRNPEMTEVMGHKISLVNVCPYPSVDTREQLKNSDYTVDLEVEKIL